MKTPAAILPIWVIAIDYILGLIMWTLIGRVAMNILLPENSNFFLMKFFVRSTDPLIRVFRPITPGLLVQPMVPFYVAWFIFTFRFYAMPCFLGCSVMGMLSFPLGGEIAATIYQILTPRP